MGMAEAPHKTPNRIPQLLPLGERSCWAKNPWSGPSQINSWLKKNHEDFTFSRDKIIASFKEYEANDGPTVAGVYFLGLSADIGYVGKANNIWKRLRTHRRNGKHFTHWWCMTGIPEPIIDDLEGFYIDLLEPPLNLADVYTRNCLLEVSAKIKAHQRAMCGPRYPDPELQ